MPMYFLLLCGDRDCAGRARCLVGVVCAGSGLFDEGAIVNN